VLRRRPALPAALSALLVLASTSALAAVVPFDGQATYQLTNNNPPGTAPVTQVVANVIPPGAIVPVNPQTSPLTILPGSSGFNESDLKVLLGSGKTPSGGQLQALALDFGAGGLAPGGVLNFNLSLDPTLNAAPTLQLPPTATGLSITEVSLPPSGGNSGGGNGGSSGQPYGNGGGGVGNVPEPMTLLIWSTGALGLGLLRARAYRRARSVLSSEC
jgi:hypothetical protein